MIDIGVSMTMAESKREILEETAGIGACESKVNNIGLYKTAMSKQYHSLIHYGCLFG